MEFSVRVSYPESKKYNWLEAVKTYKEIGFTEVAFLNPELFLNADKILLCPLKKQTLKYPKSWRKRLPGQAFSEDYKEYAGMQDNRI